MALFTRRRPPFGADRDPLLSGLDRYRRRIRCSERRPMPGTARPGLSASEFFLSHFPHAAGLGVRIAPRWR